jgi:hypothetical protein
VDYPFYIQLASQAVDDLAGMPIADFRRVNPVLRRALELPGREHLFRVLLADGQPSNWRTFSDGIEPYTAIFSFMTAAERHKRGITTSGRLVAAIPHQSHLEDVTRRLVEEANPDDSDWE